MRISVITACLNAAATIADTIESVLAQDHSDVEHIIVDGVSRDGTLEIVKRYGPRISRVVSEPDLGLYDSANKGLRMATGDVVGYLNADDYYAAPDALSTVAAAFGPGIDVVHADLDFIDPRDTSRITRRFRSRPYAPGDFRKGWHPAHPTFYARRDVLLEAGGFDERYRIAADIDLMMRVMEVRGARSVHLPRVLVKMREGGMSNRSLRHIWQANLECYRAMHRAGFAVPWWFVLRKPLAKTRQLLPF
ncbi:MAG: glycosyltransferase family 2 protein [bacterium]|jgi:glycosyltransferase involved in cell wall biosynthesis